MHTKEDMIEEEIEIAHPSPPKKKGGKKHASFGRGSRQFAEDTDTSGARH